MMESFKNIWKAMIQGDYANDGPFELYNIVLIIAFTLLPNVIILNLTVAILGDSYEETISSINERCLRD